MAVPDRSCHRHRVEKSPPAMVRTSRRCERPRSWRKGGPHDSGVGPGMDRLNMVECTCPGVDTTPLTCRRVRSNVPTQVATGRSTSKPLAADGWEGRLPLIRSSPVFPGLHHYASLPSRQVRVCPPLIDLVFPQLI